MDSDFLLGLLQPPLDVTHTLPPLCCSPPLEGFQPPEHRALAGSDVARLEADDDREFSKSCLYATFSLCFIVLCFSFNLDGLGQLAREFFQGCTCHEPCLTPPYRAERMQVCEGAQKRTCSTNLEVYQTSPLQAEARRIQPLFFCSFPCFRLVCLSLSHICSTCLRCCYGGVRRARNWPKSTRKAILTTHTQRKSRASKKETMLRYSRSASTALQHPTQGVPTLDACKCEFVIHDLSLVCFRCPAGVRLEGKLGQGPGRNKPGVVVAPA